MSAAETFIDTRHLAPKKKLLAFGWYGGKNSHLKWLLPLLPECHHFVEPFGGSAAVLLNRLPSPMETYNDLNGEICNFFTCLRDHRDDLIFDIKLTPYARSEYIKALEDNPDLANIERARRFFIKARQSFFGLGESASPGRWAFCVKDSRRGMPSVISRWYSSVAGLESVSERLLRVQIECLPALEVVKKYDSPDTLFYVDPPYPHQSRIEKGAYGPLEMTDEAHAELSEVLHAIEGRVAISGYHGPLMDDLYKSWRCVEAPAKRINSSKKGGKRAEALWMNY